MEADRLLQIGRIEAALVELKRTLGMPPTESLRLRDTLEDIVTRQLTPPPYRSVADAADRADIREAQARIAVAEAKIDRAGENRPSDGTADAGAYQYRPK